METHNTRPLQIAIDGPVGAGKSDISARLAAKLRLLYLNTGAMYRALAYACRRERIAYTDTSRVLECMRRTRIDLKKPDSGSRRPFAVFVNGTDVTEELFTPETDKGASDVSTIADVRRYLVERQQEMAQGKAVVMEGRDIGLRVLPHAQLKVFLTARVEERARRRLLQFQEKGLAKTIDDVIADTRNRDTKDSTRTADPLTKLPDHWELDTTGLSQDDVVKAIIDKLADRKLI